MFQTLDSKGNDEKGEPDNSQQFGPIVLFPAKIFGRRLRRNHKQQQLPMHLIKVWSLSASGRVNIAEIELVVWTPLHLQLPIQNSLRSWCKLPYRSSEHRKIRGVLRVSPKYTRSGIFSRFVISFRP